MLQLKNIVKIYGEGTAMPVKALKGVSLEFGEAEFVSVLGQSGCGKTTMLNIIGGLDRYTEGDLVIDGVSTKDYTDRDWDAYRNHSVGFIFQSYNLIPHQTVIKNVELALTLSGIDKETRKERAMEALKLVGLEEQVNKLPNQLSGGQMQRVAIARAIVNDPEIILADEPTGALDSETSVQVMEILKDLSRDRLVVMVTHNSELAEKYSTRIVTLSDGLIVGDTQNSSEKAVKRNAEKEEAAPRKKKDKNAKKPSMSLLTAFSLSLNNLFTKKGRTILTAFAGSIGIIGIALILSLSAGFNAYIDNIQRDTLSNYPVSITTTSYDYTTAIANLFGNAERKEENYPKTQTVTSQDTIENLVTGFFGSLGTNDLKSFKKYLDGHRNDEAISAIQYSYNMGLKLYHDDGNVLRRLSPVELPDAELVFPSGGNVFRNYYNEFGRLMNQQGVISEMIDNQSLLEKQYDVLKGGWPKSADEMVLVIDSYNQLSDMNLYMLGLMNDSDIAYVFQKIMLDLSDDTKDLSDEEKDNIIRQNLTAMGLTQTIRSKKTYSFDELMALEYDILIPTETYKKTGEIKTVFAANGEDEVEFPIWTAMEKDEIVSYIKKADNDKPITLGGTKLKISGIVRLKETATSGSLTTPLCYTPKLTKLLMEKSGNAEIVRQHQNQNYYDGTVYSVLNEYIPVDADTNDRKWGPIDESTYDTITSTLGIIDPETPRAIYIYPASFEAKDKIVKLIDDYNATHRDIEKIKYTDYIGLMMSSITTIINAVTYVLIAFVSISLIVSSIMISVITHISVLERTKEIGVLRSIGASKRDISHVFNAETAIIGFTSGILGIILTLLLDIPISIVIHELAGLANIATLPVWGGVALVVISVLLTVVAGLIPARKASKQDPVVALRSE